MKFEDFGLTERDAGVLEMMANFGGKTYIKVLEQTFWFGVKNAEQQARNRIQKLKKKKLVRHMETGLVNPKNAIVLTEQGKQFVDDFWGIPIHTITISAVTAWHNIYEQIVWYWLKKLGKDIERAIVKKWIPQGYRHTPDLYYKNDKGNLVYVEIELTRKRPDRLLDIFAKMKADGVSAVLYVFKDEKQMKTLGTKIPLWEKIRYVTIDKLIESAQNGKIGAVKQVEYLKSIGAQ